MGTEYIRNEEIPTEIVLEQGSMTTIAVPHITSALTIGNILQINLRQKSGFELDFVSLSNTLGSTDVMIDGEIPTPGTYELVLESFDEASSVQSALKTDRIQIEVSTEVENSDECTISMQAIEEIQHELETPIEITANQGEIEFITSSFDDLYDYLIEKSTNCQESDISVSLETTYDFLSLTEEMKYINLFVGEEGN